MYSATYQNFKNLMTTLMQSISTGNNRFISVFPRETKSVGLVFTKECSFVFQKRFSHPKKGCHMLKNRHDIRH